MEQFQDRKSIEKILSGAEKMVDPAQNMFCPDHFKHWARLLFFEASTRTRESFDTAARLLEMNVTQVAGPEATSLMKNESLSDTCLTYAMYGSNVLVIRTPFEGGPRFVAEYLQRAEKSIKSLAGRHITVINGGDGTNQHPTQCILDLLFIKRRKGRLDNLIIGYLGDLKYGRTSHSGIQALSKFPGNRFVLVSTKDAEMPGHYTKDADIIYKGSDVAKLGICDVIYATRPQLERIKDKLERERILKWITIDNEFLSQLKDDVVIMHPLPCTDEISPEIKLDERFGAWDQLWGGIPTRMSLLKQGCEDGELLDLSIPEVNVIAGEVDKKAKPKTRRQSFVPITEGLVIDHIPLGRAKEIKAILKLYKVPTPNVVHVTSEDNNKDIILVNHTLVPDQVTAIINYAISGCTFNFLPGNGRLIKRTFLAPHTITELFKCANPDCITNRDVNATSRFKLLGGGRHRGKSLSCHYCEKDFVKSEIVP